MDDIKIPEIKKRLEKLGISQPKMAAALSVTKDYVNKILNERKECPQRMRIKMITFIEKKESEAKK